MNLMLEGNTLFRQSPTYWLKMTEARQAMEKTLEAGGSIEDAVGAAMKSMGVQTKFDLEAAETYIKRLAISRYTSKT